MALREARVWGAKERLFERVAPLLSEHGVAHLVEAAQVCDGLVKGLKHPDWPIDPWDGLKRLVLMVCEQSLAPRPAPGLSSRDAERGSAAARAAGNRAGRPGAQ
jgi:DNA polymerase-3 subunit delta